MKFYTSIQSLGNDILVRYVEDGDHITFRDKNFNPVLFVTDNSGNSKYKTIYGDIVDKMNPGNIQQCRDFMDKYKDVENFEVYGFTDWSQQYIGKHYYGEEFDINNVRICTIDIETTCENGFPEVEKVEESVNAITIKDSITGEYYIFGVGDYYGTASDEHYMKCDSEEELLRKFLKVYRVLSPDILTGWNIKFFDVPYLYRRIEKLLGSKEAKKLSVWNYTRERIVHTMGRDNLTYILFGVAQLDYLDLYKKFTYTDQESYTLDYIASIELGERKVSYDEHKTMREFYKEDYHKFIEYNKVDVDLVCKLEKKLRLIELCVTMAYDAGINYEDVFSQTRYWDAMIYNHLRPKNIVVPSKQDFTKYEYEGGYVKEPKLGMHKWVVGFDLNSLYPHLIMQYNISPETFLRDLPVYQVDGDLVDAMLNTVKLPDLKKDSRTITGNGTFFTTDKQGFLPELMQKLYDDRVKYKNNMLECEKNNDVDGVARNNMYQMARKISLNSAYGALANQYFRFFDVRIAEAITKSGQLSIRWVEKCMNMYLNGILGSDNTDYVIAADTDSIYVNMDDLVNKVFNTSVDNTKIVDFLDKACEREIEPFIEKSYGELAEYMNAYQQKMVMKREVIADKGIWTAKKRYILNVHDSEGVRYDEPKLKVMGIECVRSSTPSSCREMIRNALSVIMNSNEKTVQKFISDFRDKFSTLSSGEVAFPRTVRYLTKYYDSVYRYKKSTPIQVKGSLLYNEILNENGLSKVYPKIGEGEKIKFLYLKEPNPLQDKVISFIEDLPNEFGLNKYIDYDTQFNKAFLEPVKTILDAIGWEHEKINTLEGFFV